MILTDIYSNAYEVCQRCNGQWKLLTKGYYSYSSLKCIEAFSASLTYSQPYNFQVCLSLSKYYYLWFDDDGIICSDDDGELINCHIPLSLGYNISIDQFKTCLIFG